MCGENWIRVIRMPFLMPVMTRMTEGTWDAATGMLKNAPWRSGTHDGEGLMKVSIGDFF
ncbi:MAG: hypothetical protein ACYCTV_07795 [Leptospirales bacterium]